VNRREQSSVIAFIQSNVVFDGDEPLFAVLETIKTLKQESVAGSFMDVSVKKAWLSVLWATQ
jgi:hypothetical protein